MTEQGCKIAIPTPPGKAADIGAYWAARANKCFTCDALIPDGVALCPSCKKEQEARARDWDDEEISQRYPALA